MDNIKILDELLLYPVYSTLTGALYLTENMEAYYFESKIECIKFLEATPNTSTENDAININKFTLQHVYSLGVDVLIVKKINEKSIRIEFNPNQFTNIVHNRFATRNLLLLRQTGKKIYLRRLGRCSFIKPILFNIREFKQYQDIHYCKAINRDVETNLLFANVHDFNLWNQHQEHNWSPIRISSKEIIRDSNGNSYNIYNHIILTSEMLSTMKEKKKEDVNNEQSARQAIS